MHLTARSRAAQQPHSLAAVGQLTSLRVDARAQVLAASFAIVVVLIAMVILNVGGLAAVWENGHWTVAAIGATVAAAIGARQATGLDRTLRRSATVALAMVTVGTIAWDLSVWLDSDLLVSVADAFWLGSLVPLGFGLRSAIRDRFSLVDRHTAYLDSLIVFAAVLGAVLVVVGPAAMAEPGVPGFLLIAYPTVLVAAIGAMVIVAANLQLGARPVGTSAMLIGFGILVVAQAMWTMAPEGSLNGSADVGTVPNTLWSLAILVLGVGGATISHREFEERGRRRFALLLQDGLPVAALAIAAFLMLSGPEIVENQTLTEALEFCVAIVVAITAVRQWLLLADRSRSVAALQLANDEMDAARREAASAAALARSVAEQRRRALDAGRLLLLHDDFTHALTSVLGLVIPEGAIGLISEIRPSTADLTVLAAAGPGSQSLADRVVSPARLAILGPPGDPEPIASAYSSSGRALPPAVARVAYAFNWAVPTAGATITVPLRSSGGHALGYLSVVEVAREHILDATYIDFVSLVANQLGVALQNRLLVEQLRAQLEERTVMQDRLVQASKLAALGVLAAGVAHEVNNPLTGVLGYSDLLLEQGVEDDEIREGLTVIRAEALRARDIVRAMLDFARPRPLERRPVDLGALVTSTVALMRFQGTRPGVRIVVEHELLPPVEVDETVVRQVLLNLLNNAMQAMPERGRITVSTRRRADNAVIAVADDGVGMTDDVRHRIFDPFFTTRGSENGHGLGLSVSLGLIEAHGGTIQVESEPNHGTRVEVSLPLQHADTPARRDRPDRVDHLADRIPAGVTSAS